MKDFIRNWLIPPKVLKYIISIKNVIEKRNYSKELFDKNKELKDIHITDRCFVIGLGNSINKQDLKLLKNEIVIGVSGLFTHKDIKDFMPSYYVLSPVFKNHLKYNKAENYISWLKAMDEVLDDKVIMIIHVSDKKYINENNIFENKEIYWDDYVQWNGDNINDFQLHTIPNINSVSEVALSIALYLGFQKIYMLGFDHTWYEKYDNHFDNEKVFKYFKKTQRDLNKEFKWDSELHMRNHAEIFKKYKALYQIKRNIFNANADKNTYVDTFPKEKYEHLFRKDGK